VTAPSAATSSKSSALAATLKNLPDQPGVYLMKDARGSVLYVGKAQSLRSRVRSYWQKEVPGPAQQIVRSVVDRISDVEYTLTDSVSEALLLENSLIKRFQPPFNVRLKDDKSYPFIKVTLADDFPRIERTRKLPQDGSRYFGPYASASSVDEAMNLVRRIFPFRTCTIDIRDGERALQRPCLLYHIKRCQGPCIQAISKEAYRADIAQVELFLEGRQESVARALRTEMQAASDRLEFERAAALRDKVRSIERTMESQKMAAFARTDLDLVGLARRDSQAAVQLFVIRNGKAIGRDVFLLEAPRESTDAEVVSGFLGQHYARASSVPREVAVPVELGDAADFERFLADRRATVNAEARGAGSGPVSETALWVRTVDTATATRRGPVGGVRLVVPRRGERRRLARELHDGMGGQMTGIGLLAQALQTQLAKTSSPLAAKAEDLVQSINDGQKQLRSIVRELMPVEAIPEGLMVALQDFAKQSETLYKVSCVFQCEKPVHFDDPTAARHVFRIVQEAVNNAVRHGQPAHVTIGLERIGPRLEIVVTDDGRGLGEIPAGHSGIGLDSMRQRARLLGGDCSIQPREGGGTLVRCWIPSPSQGAQQVAARAARPNEGPRG